VSEVIVGIDLGTSNCVVAHSDGVGEVQTLADDAGYKVHPSVVSFLPSGGVVVGAEAKQRKVIDPQNTIYSAKRLIGRSYRSPEVQMARSRMPYQIREGANQLPLISTRAGEFAIPEISGVLLDYVRNIAARALKAEVNHAVITVPANFNDAQRTATATAGAIAGITVVRVLNEPTAAALAYGHTRQLKQTIAVYDFGGGTFDVTILKLDDQVYEVLGTAGDSFLGGDDLDERLVDRMVERFLAEQRIDLRNNEVAMMRLRAVAEQTKIELSRRTRAVVRIDEIAYGARGAPLNLQIEVSREEFVAMTSDIIQRTFPVCQEALKLAGLGIDRIDDIVLVGGTTKVPTVRELVAKFFARSPRNDINPEEAVAIGAALQADSLQRILARPSRTSMAGSSSSASAATMPAAAAQAASDDGEQTSQGAAPMTSDTAVTAGPSPGGRARRPTADAGMRPFSERPVTRGASVDRVESRGDRQLFGATVGRVTTSATGTTAVGMIPAQPGQIDTSVGLAATQSGEPTSTRRSYVAPDEEESTAARVPVEPYHVEDLDELDAEEATSSGAPEAVRPEATRSSRNPAEQGRGPAQIGAPQRTTGQMGMAGPGGSAANRATMLQQTAQPTQPLPPPRAPSLAPGRAAPAAPPSTPAAPPPAPMRSRISQPRIAAPSGVPLRDSMPAIDDSQVHVLPVQQGSGSAGSMHLDPGASSTAPGMSFPHDPAVTARGLVPNVPTSLAGQSMPMAMPMAMPSPAVTARGVAPASPTMMIGAGLASAGPAAAQWPQAPVQQAEPLFPPASAGPQARTMIAQAPKGAGAGSAGSPDERFFQSPVHPPVHPPPSHASSPFGGYGPPGLGPIPGGSFQPAGAAAPDPFAPFDAPPPPMGLAGQPDAFSNLPPTRSGGAQLRTPPPFAQASVRRPGDEEPFFGTPPTHGGPIGPGGFDHPPAGYSQPGGYPQPGGLPPSAPTMAAMQAPMQAMHAMQAMPSPIVLDVTPFGLGMVTVAGFCEELIRRNTRVPTEIRRSFSTSRDGQDLVRLVVTQGESRRVEGNTVLGELILAELPRRPRGETTIEVTFSIDASGILHVRARDALSGREQRASLNVIGTIPEGDVAASRDRMQQLRR
jgi:molecular chaperone DnaK